MDTASPRYATDLTDAEWALLQPLLPADARTGRPRRHSLRTVFDALVYLLRTGCLWRYLPSHFPPWQTVYYHFRQFCRTGLWTHL
jgi:putative transposase